MQASWAVGLGKGKSILFVGAVLHGGVALGLKLDRCLEGCPDGVTAFSAGGPRSRLRGLCYLGIPWSHPVATWAAGRCVAQGLSDPCVDTTML